MQIPTYITTICEAFVQKFPQLNSPEKVFGTCEYMCNTFCKLVSPTIKAKPLHVIGHRTVFPNRYSGWDFYPNPDMYFYHVVVQIEDHIIIDVTYRQFDIHSSTAYKIMSIEEFKENWMTMADEYETVNDIGAIETLLRQSRRGFIKKAHHLTDVQTITISHLKWWEQLVKCYVDVNKLITSGDLILTGTDHDNPYKKRMSRLVKFGIERCPTYLKLNTAVH